MKLDQKYLSVRQHYKDEYDKIKESYCIAIKSKVTWNSKGFNHFIYKNGGEKEAELSKSLDLKIFNWQKNY